MEKSENNFQKKFYFGNTWDAKNEIRGLDNYKMKKKIENEKRKQYETEKWIEQRDQYKKNELQKQLKYINFVYGKNLKNKKLANKTSDEWEIYKARQYVYKENLNGHECYNAVEGKKLWVNHETWTRIKQEKIKNN